MLLERDDIDFRVVEPERGMNILHLLMDAASMNKDSSSFKALVDLVLKKERSTINKRKEEGDDDPTRDSIVVKSDADGNTPLVVAVNGDSAAYVEKLLTECKDLYDADQVNQPNQV